jgi:EpsI family protein
MLSVSASTRLKATVAILLGASILMYSMSHGEAIVPRQTLRELPNNLANWSGEDRPIPDQVLRTVGVTDYANRVYYDSSGAPVMLYIGYYGSQRTGDTIHSPKNCLPGSGWDPIESRHASISIPGGHDIIVNEYAIQKDLDKELVFYWYQSRGRVIADEYSGKFWMMVDAIYRNRTDGSLVRVMTPINDGEAKAHTRLVEFTQLAYPQIDALLPK